MNENTKIFLAILEKRTEITDKHKINFNFLRSQGNLIEDTRVKHLSIISHLEFLNSVSESLFKENTLTNVDKI
jgi:hypothetical protein